ncbi:MAG: hypothetical protein ACXVCY_11360 [Pseudobdellovibrionaceae bacterium]
MRIAILCVFFLVKSAIAGPLRFGPIGSGGGKGIFCSDEGYERLYLADTFPFFYSKDLNDPEKFSDLFFNALPNEVVEAAVVHIEKTTPQKKLNHPFFKNKKVSLGWMLAHTYANLGIVYNSKLKQVSDDHIKLESLPQTCRKKVQVAVQNFSKNTVELNPNLLFSWTSAETGFLLLHETFLALRGHSGDTTPIRKQVRQILNDTPESDFSTVLQSLIEASHSNGFPKIYTNESLYFYKFCRDYDRDSQKKEKCLSAKAAMEKQWQEASEKPVLKKIPDSLSCQIVNEKANGDYWTLPHQFAIKIDNKNSDASMFNLDFFSLKKAVTLTGRLKTEGHSSFNSFDKFGNVEIQFGGVLPDLGRLSISIFRYSERTEEFIGTLNAVSTSAMINFGISCYPLSRVEFERRH